MALRGGGAQAPGQGHTEHASSQLGTSSNLNSTSKCSGSPETARRYVDRPRPFPRCRTLTLATGPQVPHSSANGEVGTGSEVAGWPPNTTQKGRKVTLKEAARARHYSLSAGSVMMTRDFRGVACLVT